ncbi:MAG: ABC transporter ATP-binding protein [Porticoccus sp.]|nr:ABC transporter ATP-binding protein [Porticoccus sp.]MBQ0807850.1 ABC transporter ATP-binding protein [Porticoccus sp.]
MTPALSIRNLHKVYDSGFVALKGLDLEVQPGDFFALLGPNGAGKSTTIGVICSLVKKTSGDVSIFGTDIDKDFSLAKKDIGVVPQEFNFNQFDKVYDIVKTQGGYFGLPPKLAGQRAEKYLKKLGLWDKRNQISRTLSGGMKRRLMIARALVHEPKLLILDEPTAGVDIEIRRSMWQFLKEINENGTTIILTTHYLEEAENLCRNVAIIDRGLIVQNSSTKALLRKLSKEVFILDAQEELTELPQMGGYKGQLIDSHSFEVEIEKHQSINELFASLSEQGIHVVSMRNKTNRLEELFVSLVASHNTGTHTQANADAESRQGEV